MGRYRSQKKNKINEGKKKKKKRTGILSKTKKDTLQRTQNMMKGQDFFSGPVALVFFFSSLRVCCCWMLVGGGAFFCSRLCVFSVLGEKKTLGAGGGVN